MNSHRRHRNPFRRHRRRRNPSFGGFDAKQVVYLGAGAAAGSLGTRKLVQMLLGANNSGAVGYAADLAGAIALGWAARKFLHSDDLAKGVLAGGIGAVILRIWSENVSQVTAAAKAVSGLGDVEFSSDGLGAYIASAFPLPTHSDTQGNYIVSSASTQLANPALAASGSAAPSLAMPTGPTAGVSRFQSRFS